MLHRLLHSLTQEAAEKAYFAGFSARSKQLAEREGFEPPIGLHLCRISSAVHSTTLPPLRGATRAILPARSAMF